MEKFDAVRYIHLSMYTYTPFRPRNRFNAHGCLTVVRNYRHVYVYLCVGIIYTLPRFIAGQLAIDEIAVSSCPSTFESFLRSLLIGCYIVAEWESVTSLAFVFMGIPVYASVIVSRDFCLFVSLLLISFTANSLLSSNPLFLTLLSTSLFPYVCLSPGMFFLCTIHKMHGIRKRYKN